MFSSYAKKNFKKILESFGYKSEKIDNLEFNALENGIPVLYKLVVDKKLLSHIYKLDITYQYPINIPINATAMYKYNVWKCANIELTGLLKLAKIESCFLGIDLESIHIKIDEGILYFTIRPIPASCVAILIPPMRYFISIRESEVLIIQNALIPKILKEKYDIISAKNEV